MIIAIDKKPKIIKTEPFETEYNEVIKTNIKKNWEDFIVGKSNFWDGDIYSVSDYDKEENELKISKAKFSEFIYSKQTNEISVRSLFCSILLKTSDDYYVVIKNNHNNINITGGIVDERDFVNNEISPKECIKRELMEELKLNINEPTQLKEYEIKYLKVPINDEIIHSSGIIYVGHLTYSKDELLEYFELNKDKLDNEIKELYCYKYQECLDLPLTDKDISYLKEIIKFENSDY